MSTIIILPTFNEAENLPRLIKTIMELPLDISVMVIDDNSPDGTGKIAQALSKEYPGKLSVIIREKKMGLGSAYIVGFKKALEMGADAIVQMDSDFSHDPQVLIKMHEKINSCDVVSGSRYVPGGSLDTEWPIWRKALSMFGNFYAKIILRIPVKDMTTGFRMWSRQAMQRMPLDQIRSNGYAFQVEMIYVASLLGFNIIEEPIYFANRTAGESKITFQIQLEGAIRTLEMQWHYRDLKKNNKKPRTTI